MDEQSIFLGALEKSNSDEVARWLEANCGANRELRERIEAMLESHQQDDSFLERPVDELMETACLATGGEAAAAGHPSVLRSIGKRLGEVKGIFLPDTNVRSEDPVVRPSSNVVPKSGIEDRYQFFGEIARGGMGAVIKGRDTDLGRDLAVKVLLDDHKHRPEMIQRFIEEAQIGGQLQHPGIAPVYELGEFADQRPFFTMKLVKGKTLAALLAERTSPEQDQAKLLGIFEQVCQTMAYAHSRSVIHRDLKPANIMVGAFGEVQVMDWGLAKVLQTGGIADETRAVSKPKDVSIVETVRSGGSQTYDGASVGSQTHAGSVMGTPAYMSPEQATGDAELLDARADVFGLGAILCEILTGEPAYIADNGRELLRMAARADLDSCRQRLTECSAHADLVELTNHCLAADPAKRLSDAGVVSNRVTEHIESIAQKLRQAEVRRKLTYVMAASLLLLVAGLGAGGIWLQARESMAANQVAAAQQQRADEQEAANKQLQQTLYASQVQLAGSHLEGGRIAIADRTLDSLRPGEGKSDLRGFEWHYLKKLSLLPEDRGKTDWASYAENFYRSFDGRPLLNHLEFSRDGERLLAFQRSLRRAGKQSLTSDGKGEVLDTQTMNSIWMEERSNATLSGMLGACMSSDGKRVGIYSNQGDYNSPKHHFEILDVDSGEKTALEAPKELATAFLTRFLLSPNGELLAAIRRVRNRSTLAVWNTTEGNILYEKSLPETMSPFGLVFSPDSGSILTPEIDKTGDLIQSSMTMWNAKSGEKVRTFEFDPGQRPSLLLFSELGGLASGQRRKAGLRSAPGRPIFSSDGNLIAVSGENANNADRRALWVWDAKSGKRILSREVNTRSFKPSTFSPDNKLILHHGGEVFRISDGQRLHTFASFSDHRMIDVQFSNGNRVIDGITETGEQFRWRAPLINSEMHPRGQYCVSPDGSQLACLSAVFMSDTRFWISNHLGKRSQLKLPATDQVNIPNPATTAINDEGRYLALTIAELERAEFQLDTPLVLTLWDTSDASRYATLWRPGESEQLIAAHFVPVRGWLAGVVRTSEEAKPISDQLIFWDVKTKEKLHSIDLPKSEGIAFSPDGENIAIELNESGDGDHVETVLSIVSLADLKERQRLSIKTMESNYQQYLEASFRSDFRQSRVAFRPGKAEVAVMNREMVEIWDLKSKSVRETFGGVNGDEAFGWTADGSRFITVQKENEQGDSVMTVWNPDNGNRLLVHGLKCFIQPGNSLKKVPGTNKLFSWAGNIQYLDGTPLE